MNELVKQIKNIKLNKKSLSLVFLAIGAVCLLLLSELPVLSENEELSSDDTYAFSSQYTEKTEKELQKILEKIEGAGQVKVMVTLESCYENIYAKSYETENKQDADSVSENLKEEYVIIKKNSNNEESLIIKVYEPEIKGVAVVCEGGGNTQVKKAITETVCALFDVSSAKVSVTKMNKR